MSANPKGMSWSEFHRRVVVFASWHRPLPPGSGRELDKPDALLGLDLDEVLEGPDQAVARFAIACSAR